MNKLITPYVNFMKTNKNEIFLLKFIIVIIINVWLLFIFWRIILLNGLNFNNNNIYLTKMNTVMQPLLFALGIDYLSPNALKMIIISTIVLGVNLSVLYFNQMALLIISIAFARYGYKSYSNYLINKENMHYMGFETIKQPEIIQKPIEQTPIIIETATNTTNWWMWGTIIVIGVISVAGIAFAIWSHNTNSHNIIETSQASVNLSNSINDRVSAVNEKTTHMNSQIDLVFTNHGKTLTSLTETDNLLNQKMKDLETGFQTFGSQIAKLEKNNIDNIQLLSTGTLEISKEAKAFFGNVMESNTATEALIISIAQLVDGFNILTERLITAETRLDSMTGSTTPRNSIIFKPIASTRLNQPTNLNE